MMHQRISRKIIIYLFLFTILASVNNLKYINLQIFKIDQINISGLDNIDNANLHESIKNYLNLYFLKF